MRYRVILCWAVALTLVGVSLVSQADDTLEINNPPPKGAMGSPATWFLMIIELVAVKFAPLNRMPPPCPWVALESMTDPVSVNVAGWPTSPEMTIPPPVIDVLLRTRLPVRLTTLAGFGGEVTFVEEALIPPPNPP